MANASILAAFERMWNHIVLALNNKADSEHTQDWDTIENRPFGEVPGTDTVYWDGNREGLIKADGYDRYLVSTAVPTLADFENGASNTKLLSGTESTSNLGMGTAIYEAGDGCIVVGNTIVALKDGASLGDEVYPKKGTYFTWIGNDSYTVSMTINGYTGFLVTKKIDMKYLPDDIGGPPANVGPTPIVTTGDGAEYIATIEGVTELYNGLQFVMIPHTNSTTTSVKLNVNDLGAKIIRQRLTTNTSIGVVGATDNWIVANKPVTVTYNGTAWMVEIPRADANNLYGTVKVENGGVPGTSDVAEGAVLRNVDGVPTWNELTAADVGAAPSSHTHTASDVTSGTLGVVRGGTGKATHTSNAVLTGNGTNAVNNVATASGALFATSANGAAKFGTLPIAQGGTGATTAAAALKNLGGVSMKLLWENASFGSDFAQQTIALDLSGYSAVMITANGESSYFVPVGDIAKITSFNGYYICRRDVTVSTTGVWFGSVDVAITYGTSASHKTENPSSQCRPYKIYGIKGVS